MLSYFFSKTMSEGWCETGPVSVVIAISHGPSACPVGDFKSRLANEI